MAAMQEELAKLGPDAIEQLPKELKEALPQGFGGGLPKGIVGLPRGLGGSLPGLGGIPKFPGLPGKKK
jgi:signal recognition particle subunit SRP54